MMFSRRMAAGAVSACAITATLLAGPAVVAQAPQPAGDPAAAILASHKVIDDGYARAVMSPFTAVAVQYFEPGQTVRLGIGGSSVAFAPTAPMAHALDITLEGGAFWVTPVAGTAPVLLKTGGEGDVSGLPGTVVTARLKLSARDVIGLGGHFVEFYARPDTGNARVFDPEAPARKAFTGLKWFAPNLALRPSAVFVPAANPAKLTIMTSRGLQKEYFRVGVFEFAIDGKPMKLAALATSPIPAAGEELFVPFRDATTGHETYEVGRYLTVPFTTAGAAYVLDFNAVTNPLCNYSAHYNCPIPPRENVLSVPIRAGEMTYPKPH